MSFFESSGFLERISTGVIVTFSMILIIFNEVGEVLVFASRIVSDFKRMTAEATFQALRCFADVLSTTTPGFSCNNVYQI